MEILIEISKQLEIGDDEKVYELTKDAIGRNIEPKLILNDGLISGMNVIGEQFRKQYAGMELLKPLFIKEEIPTLGKIVIGTVKGDLHDLGKNLVGIMLKGAGFEVIDLGKDVPPEKFVETAKEERANLIGMSALLTTTLPVMQEVIHLLKQNNLNSNIKTIIGGAPVSKEYAEKIGADAFAFDASNSVKIAKELMVKI